ncbi:MAG: hypothetical protein ACSLFK_00095, partial [Gemmatimonadaceae bacterium]
MRIVFVLAFSAAACASGDAASGKAGIPGDSVTVSTIGATPVDSPATAIQAGGNFSAEIQRLRTDLDAPIRALYLNRFAAQSTRKMRNLIAVADST